MEYKECCGTCKWHEIEVASTYPDWVCCNEDSPYYTDYTGYRDACSEWEAR